MISAVVLSHNCQKTISRCLKSLNFCEEIIVIDDYSTDQTRQVAAKNGASIFLRHLKADFSSQRNFGLNKVKNEWVLFVDADEEVTEKLRKEIKTAIEKTSSQIQGFYFKRRDKLFDRYLKYGETGKLKFLRLARKQAGKWEGKVHEVWQIKGPIKNLSGFLLHKRSMSVAQFIKRLNRYAQIRAKELYNQRKKEGWWRLFLFPGVKFFQNYIWRLGFLDGFSGLVMAWLMSWHSLLVRIWLRLYWRNKGQEIFKVNSKSW